MKSELIVLITFIILWLAGYGTYLVQKNKKPKIIAKGTIKGSNYNSFLPDDNQIKDLTVNIVFDEKNEINNEQFCDLVIKAKDLINSNISTVAKSKNDIFKEKEALPNKTEVNSTLLKLSDVEFSKYIKINQIVSNNLKQ